MILPGFFLGLPFGIGIGLVYCRILQESNEPLGFSISYISNLLSHFSPNNFQLIAVFIFHVMMVLLPYYFAGVAVKNESGSITRNQREWFWRGMIFGVNWGINFIILSCISALAAIVIMSIHLFVIMPWITTRS